MPKPTIEEMKEMKKDEIELLAAIKLISEHIDDRWDPKDWTRPMMTEKAEAGFEEFFIKYIR